jgi:hypothetical protein
MSSLNSKHVQHVKIYIPCKFEVNLITYLGVTALFSSIVFFFISRRFLWEFPIGSYVKLSSAVAAILVGGLKCPTQFWKGTTQGSFQQSLVEIGSVVSEEKIL